MIKDKKMNGILYQRLDEIENKLTHTQDLFNDFRHQTINERATAPTFGSDLEIERKMKDIENRMMDQVNQKLDSNFRNLQICEDKLENSNVKLARDMATDIKTLESRMSEFIKKVEEV